LLCDFQNQAAAGCCHLISSPAHRTSNQVVANSNEAMLHVHGCVQYGRNQLEAHLEEEGDPGMVLIVLLSGDVVVSLPPK
jgi:hypothetical protein